MKFTQTFPRANQETPEHVFKATRIAPTCSDVFEAHRVSCTFNLYQTPNVYHCMGRDGEAGLPLTTCWTKPLGARPRGWAWRRLTGPMGIVCLARAEEGRTAAAARTGISSEPLGAGQGAGWCGTWGWLTQGSGPGNRFCFCSEPSVECPTQHFRNQRRIQYRRTSRGGMALAITCRVW